MKSLGCLCYFITGIPPAPCTSKRRRRLYPHDGNPSQDPCAGLRFYFPLYSWCKVKAEPNFLSHYILTFISRGAYHSRRRWTWSTVPGPPQDPCTGFFNLVPGYSWCGGAVGMFFILNYYFPIDRSSSALFVAQKTEALSTWWEPLPGPLHRFFSFLFLMGSELYIYFLCWKKIDDVKGLCLIERIGHNFIEVTRKTKCRAIGKTKNNRIGPK